MWGGMDPKQHKRWEQVLTGTTCYRSPEGQFKGARSPSEVLDEAGATSLFFAPDKTEEQSPPRELPDFGIGDIQLQVHQVSLSTLVQLAVLRNLSQEGVLGVKWAGRKDKGPLVTLLQARGAPCIQACSLCLQSRLP